MAILNFLWKHRFLVTLLILAAVICFALVEYNKSKNRISDLEISVRTYGTQNADLRMTTKDLKTELKKEMNRTLDSLLKSNKIKPAQVKNVYITNTTINNNDTTYVTDTVGNDRPSLVKTPFVDDRNCIRIEGFVLSTDSFPSVAITSQNAEIETYDVTYKRKWWEFWKPKESVKTYTKCGNLEVKKIRNTDYKTD